MSETLAFFVPWQGGCVPLERQLLDALASPAGVDAARELYQLMLGCGTVEVAVARGGFQVSWALPEGGPEPFAHALELLGRGAIPGATLILRALLQQRPHDPEVLLHLGLAEQLGAALPGAIAHLRELVRLDPSHARGWLALGRALERADRADEAIAATREAVRLAPEDAVARGTLGWLLAGAGRPDEALPHLREALRLAPTDQEAHYLLGHALVDRGRREDADEADGLLERAIALDPASPTAQECRQERGRLRFRWPGAVADEPTLRG